jgi:A/G-specific adenine glycosylase
MDDCVARKAGVQELLPAKAPKAERPKRAGAAFYLRRADGAVLMRTRPPKGLLGGMTELPGTDWRADFDEARALQAAPTPADWRRVPGRVTHVFTHFELTLSVYVAAAPQDAPAPPGARWVAADAVDGEALPNLMRKALALARESLR